MSDANLANAPFFTLFRQGQVSEDGVSDFVAAWHEASDNETRSLPAYLGMTDEEYEVWVLDGRTLPLILAARLAGTPLRSAVGTYLAELRKHQRYVDGTAIDLLTRWIARNPPP